MINIYSCSYHIISSKRSFIFISQQKPNISLLLHPPSTTKIKFLYTLLLKILSDGILVLIYCINFHNISSPNGKPQNGKQRRTRQESPPLPLHPSRLHQHHLRLRLKWNGNQLPLQKKDQRTSNLKSPSKILKRQLNQTQVKTKYHPLLHQSHLAHRHQLFQRLRLHQTGHQRITQRYSSGSIRLHRTTLLTSLQHYGGTLARSHQIIFHPRFYYSCCNCSTHRILHRPWFPLDQRVVWDLLCHCLPSHCRIRDWLPKGTHRL